MIPTEPIEEKPFEANVDLGDEQEEKKIPIHDEPIHTNDNLY